MFALEMPIQEVAVMIKQKKHWYIWFSFPAVMFLVCDTASRTLFSAKNRDYWYQACRNIFKLAIICFVLPPFLLGFFADRVLLRNVPNESIAYDITILIILFVMYLCGVYMAYRHVVWRIENISHLL